MGRTAVKSRVCVHLHLDVADMLYELYEEQKSVKICSDNDQNESKEMAF